MDDANLDEYLHVYPKSIKIKSEDLDIDELVEISELYDPSIFSFESVYVEINSVSHFEKVLLFSKKSIEVLIYMSELIMNDFQKVFEVNF